MAISQEIIDFEEYHDKQAIKNLLASFDNKDTIYNNLFKMSIIQQYSDSAKFIYSQAITNDITINIFESLMLAVKYQCNEIIKELYQQNTSISHDNKLSMLKETLIYGNKEAFVLLFNHSEYNNEELNDLLNLAFDNTRYSIAVMINNISHSFNANKQDLSYRLSHNCIYLYEIDDREIEDILSLITLGASPLSVENSEGILLLVYEEDFTKLSKLLLVGAKVENSFTMIDSFLHNEGIDKEQFNLKIDKLNSYLLEQYPNHNFNITKV